MTNLANSAYEAAVRAESMGEVLFDYHLGQSMYAPQRRAKVWELLKTILRFAAKNPWWVRFLPKSWQEFVKAIAALAVEILEVKPVQP